MIIGPLAEYDSGDEDFIEQWWKTSRPDRVLPGTRDLVSVEEALGHERSGTCFSRKAANRK